jgi:hypothetical protein
MEIISAEQAIENAKGLTFEKVWAVLMENAKAHQRTEEAQEKTAKAQEKTAAAQEKTAAAQKKTDEALQITAESQRKSEEMQRKTDEALQKTEILIANLSRKFGRLGNSFGDLVEAMFIPNLYEKFNKLGYDFSQQSSNKIFIENHKQIAEVDIVVENGEFILLVEIKAKLSVDNINEHLERIETVRRYMDRRNDSRKLIGAVAGGIVSDIIIDYAQQKGLFVIIQSGDSIEIAKMPENFTARTW